MTMYILLIKDEKYAGNPFGGYLAEILRTEGLNFLHEIHVDEFGKDALIGCPAVILAESSPDDAHLNVLMEYVKGGGHLLACRPNSELLRSVGVTVDGGMDEGYWLPLADMADRLGVADRALQFHGGADCYALPACLNARIHALLGVAGGLDAQNQKHPAAFSLRIGAGELCVMAFDPARSVAYMRQGNPIWAGTAGIVLGGASTNTLRPHDMFTRTDGRKWNDPALSAIPQADITQRFLAELALNILDFPAPRMWCLPAGAKTVVGILADCDEATGEQIAAQALTATAHGARVSFYMIDHAIENTSPVTVEVLNAVGHETAIHPDYHTEGDTSNPNAAGMQRTFAKIIEKFEKKFSRRPRTSRNHSATWLGWVEQARLEREFGIRFNSMHGHRPIMGTTMWGAGPAGYICGTGQPQKFVDEKGEVLDIYQAPVHMTDETLRTYVCPAAGRLQSSPYEDADKWAAERPDVVMPGLSAEAAFDEIRKMVAASESGWHGFLLYHWHPITLHQSARARKWFGDYVLPYLQENGIPVWTTEMILDFVDARNGVRLDNIKWLDNTLSFQAATATKRSDLTVAVPAVFNGLRATTVRVNGRIEPASGINRVGGRNCLLLALRGWPACVEVNYS